MAATSPQITVELTEDETIKAARLLKLLSKREAGYSIAYCLWHLGYRTWSSYEEEDIQTGISFYKESFKQLEMPCPPERDIRPLIVEKLEQQSIIAKKCIGEQKSWWELYSKLTTLIEVWTPYMTNSRDNDVLSRIRLTREGIDFVKKNQPYKLVSKLGNFYNNVTKFFEPQIHLENLADAEYARTVEKLSTAVSAIQRAIGTDMRGPR